MTRRIKDHPRRRRIVLETARTAANLIIGANARHGGDDHCHECQRPLTRGEVTLIGEDAEGEVLVVAKCCYGRLTRIWGVGFFFAHRDAPLAALEPWGRA